MRRIDEALALANETGDHWTRSLNAPHPRRNPAEARSRRILRLPRKPSRPPSPSRKQQDARSFELRAALALAKLYQSTGRPADAHAVLAPALEGFSPTPEMPEIAEAQALLAALAETEEVKAAIGQRRRRLDLQTSYGQALLLGKGFAAEETEAAFARVAELAGQKENPAARLAAFYAQCIGSSMSGRISPGAGNG